MPYTITFLNHKGGVGKTTLVATVAAALARSRHRVLVIDLDAQGNVSDRLIGAFKRDRPHAFDLIMDEADEVDARNALYKARAPFDSVNVIAGDDRLARADRDLHPGDRPDAWKALDRKIEPLLGDYDFILIDNPPSLNILTSTGLVLASRDGGYVVPLDLGKDSTKGANKVQAAVEKLHKAGILVEKPDFLGVVFSVFLKGASKGIRTSVASAEEAFGGALAAVKIPHSSYVVEAANAGKVVLETHPQSTVAEAFVALAEALTGEKLAEIPKPKTVTRAGAATKAPVKQRAPKGRGAQKTKAKPARNARRRKEVSA